MRMFARSGFVRWSDTPFILRSGKPSHIYVEGRGDLTSYPEEMWLLCRQILRVTNVLIPDQTQRPCFIGLPTAGTSIASACSMVDLAEGITGRRAMSLTMREQRKIHGSHQRLVNGRPELGVAYVSLDNVVTDGGTKIDAIKGLGEDGFDVDQMRHVVVIDRQQGAAESLAKHGISLTALYLLLDIVYVFGKLKLWPPERVAAVETEIGLHAAAA